jgi:hypothetical protein
MKPTLIAVRALASSVEYSIIRMTGCWVRGAADEAGEGDDAEVALMAFPARELEAMSGDILGDPPAGETTGDNADDDVPPLTEDAALIGNAYERKHQLS